MKTLKLFSCTLILIIMFTGCQKAATTFQSIPIPNGDFENWTSDMVLQDWQTNSCPACVPPYETYVVQQITDAISGKYAAEFIYNRVYRSWAYNKFEVPAQPSMLTGYVKDTVAGGDTVSIRVDLYSGIYKADSSFWSSTQTISGYQKIEISLPAIADKIDSASIKITGGDKQNTVLYVDDLHFLESN